MTASYAILALLLANASPAVSPAPAGVTCAYSSAPPAAGSPPILSCSERAPADWLARLKTIHYTSQSGDSVELARALGGFTLASVPGPPPWVEYDRTRGLLLVCMAPGLGQSCFHAVIVRTADVGVPGGAVPAAVNEPSIGMSLDRLLATLRKDPNFAQKSLTKGPSGTVVMVWALDEFPGPKDAYDHGWQGYSYQLYLLCDGVVVASARQIGEN